MIKLQCLGTPGQEPLVHHIQLLADLGSKCSLLRTRLWKLAYLMEMLADMVQVAGGILGRWIECQQANFRNRWIGENALTWEVLCHLGIGCPVVVVYDACMLAAT